LDLPFPQLKPRRYFEDTAKILNALKILPQLRDEREEAKGRELRCDRGKKGVDSNAAFVLAIHAAGGLTPQAKKAYIAYRSCCAAMN
jgi:hypothetical protein